MNNNNNGKKKQKKTGRKGLKAASANLNNTAKKARKLVTLSKPTVDYARCLGNPFSGPLAQLPNAPANHTKKFRTFIRGGFEAQTSNGHAWIMATPRVGVVNDVSSVSGSLTTGTNISWFNTSVGADRFFATTNSEYTTAQVGTGENQLEYRVVSSGLRIRYTGTELNRGGIVVGIQDPNHNSLQDRLLTSVDAEEVSRRFNVKRDWITILYSPVNNGDLNFHSTLPAGPPELWYLGFAIQAPAGTPSTYEFEFYSCYEAFGKNIRAMTPSPVDAAGFAAVHSASSLGSALRPTDSPVGKVERTILAATAKHMAVSSSHSQDVIGDIADITTTGKNIIDMGGKLLDNADLLEDIWDIGSGILSFLF